MTILFLGTPTKASRKSVIDRKHSNVSKALTVLGCALALQVNVSSYAVAANSIEGNTWNIKSSSVNSVSVTCNADGTAEAQNISVPANSPYEASCVQKGAYYTITLKFPTSRSTWNVVGNLAKNESYVVTYPTSSAGKGGVLQYVYPVQLTKAK